MHVTNFLLRCKVTQIVKKFHRFYAILKFTAVFKAPAIIPCLHSDGFSPV
jgi:hypothetical protein